MYKTLTNYLPEASIDLVIDLLNKYPHHLKIVNKRQTKHGDFKRKINGDFQITLNNTLNKYQFLFTLMNEGRLKLVREYGKKVTYHDPCYLGRHNDIYDEPRNVLEKIPGLDLIEMTDSGKDSLCCGGGGGRIWMDTPKGERFSDLRLAQAKEAGADVLVTACPYCITNFEESRLNLEYENVLEIKDITEIIQEVI